MLLFLLQDAKPAWYSDPMVTATVVVAIATVVNVVATLLLWLTTRRQVNVTRDMFEASHRPYVYAEVELSEDDEGSPVFVVTYENVGSVPAHDLKQNIRIIIDGVVRSMEELEEDPPTAVFPQRNAYVTIVASDSNDKQAVQNAKALSVHIKCTYKGVTDKIYSYEDKAVYDPEDGDFSTAAVST